MDLNSAINDTMGFFITYIPRMAVFQSVIKNSFTVIEEAQKINQKLSTVWSGIPDSNKKAILLDNNIEIFIQYISDKNIKEDLEYSSNKNNSLKFVKISFTTWFFSQLANKRFDIALNYYKTGMLNFCYNDTNETTVKNEFIYNFIKHGMSLVELKTLPVQDFKNPELLWNVFEDNNIPDDIFSWILGLNDMDISWHDCAFEKDKAIRITEKKRKTHNMIDAFPIRAMTDYGHSLKDYLAAPYTFEKIINSSPKKSEILSSDFYKQYFKNYPSSFREIGNKILTTRNSRKIFLFSSVFKYFDFSNINEKRLSFFMRACLEFNKLYLLKAGNKVGNDVFKHAPENLKEQMLSEFMRERQIAYSGEDMLILLSEMNVTQINTPELLKKMLRLVISNNDFKSLTYINQNIIADKPASELFTYYLNVSKNFYTSTLPNCSHIMMYFYNLMSYADKVNTLERNKYHSEKAIYENNIDLHFMLFIMQKRENLEFMSFLDLLNEEQKSSFSEEGLKKIKLTVIDRVAKSNNKKNIKPLDLIKQIGITYDSTDIAYAVKHHRVNNYIMNFLCSEPIDENTSVYKHIINEYIKNASSYQYNSGDFRAVFTCMDRLYQENDIEETFLLTKETIIKLKEKGICLSGVNSLNFYHDIFQYYAKIHNLELPPVPKKIPTMETVKFLMKDLDIINIAQEKILINSLISDVPVLKKRRI